MDLITDYFRKNKIMLLDGATGTQMIERGLQAGECPELWNINKKEAMKSIASAYYKAGSDAVLTNTFGASLLKLRSYGLEDKIYELNAEGVRNVADVRPEGKYILASMGPSGEIPEPFGEVTLDELTASYSKQVKILTEAGVDGFMLETFSDINEIACAIQAIKEHSNLPIIASLTYNKTGMGYHTMMGTSIEEAVDFLRELDVFAIGSNCGYGIKNMIEVGTLLREQSKDIRIMVKPNAGEPVLKDGKNFYTEDPEYFRSKASELLAFKPSFIGGCCGTTPRHIKVMREIIDNG